MPLPLAKALCLGGGVAGIAAVGGTVIYLNQKDNKKQEETNPQQNSPEDKALTPKETKGKAISDWLDKEGFELLKENQDSAKWIENWGKFVDANPNNNLDEHWTFAEYGQRKGNKEEAPTEFKKVCEKNGKIEIKQKEGSQYDKVKLYCSKEKPKDAS